MIGIIDHVCTLNHDLKAFIGVNYRNSWRTGCCFENYSTELCCSCCVQQSLFKYFSDISLFVELWSKLSDQVCIPQPKDSHTFSNVESLYRNNFKTNGYFVF